VTLDEINALGREDFVAALGWIVEESPWVAQRAWERRPFASREALHAAMTDVVDRADPAEQLELLRAHPDLGARAKMSAASSSEQAGARLDQLTPAEYERLHWLNARYREKFGFPFLLAVKGNTKSVILQALELRLQATPSEEFRQALAEVSRIALFRLEQVTA